MRLMEICVGQQPGGRLADRQKDRRHLWLLFTYHSDNRLGIGSNGARTDLNFFDPNACHARSTRDDTLMSGY